MKLAISIILLVLIGTLQALTIPAQSDDNEIISVDSSTVVINAAVTDASGKAARSLSANMFRVLEDGVEQRIESFYAEDTPFAAVILLDTSGSMEQRITLARAAAIQFLGGIRAEDFVAIFNFASKIEMVQDFSNTRDMSQRAFDLR